MAGPCSLLASYRVATVPCIDNSKRKELFRFCSSKLVPNLSKLRSLCAWKGTSRSRTTCLHTSVHPPLPAVPVPCCHEATRCMGTVRAMCYVRWKAWDNGRSLKHGTSHFKKENLFCCEGGQALAKLLGEVEESPSLGTFQLSWAWPWATCCRWPSLSRGLGPDNLQTYLLASALCFCNEPLQGFFCWVDLFQENTAISNWKCHYDGRRKNALFSSRWVTHRAAHSLLDLLRADGWPLM